MRWQSERKYRRTYTAWSAMMKDENVEEELVGKKRRWGGRRSTRRRVRGRTVDYISTAEKLLREN